MSPPPDLSPTAIVGHERERERLRAAAADQRLAHALLFAGPDGIGKRTVAVGLATWLHCSQRGVETHSAETHSAETHGAEACGSCAPCRQVAAGSHPDMQVVGIAAGRKEIGIDRIRELKRFMQLRPVAGTAKIAIIDDAHMLTVAAQNALLKTLEEPPHGSLVILVASTADALLPTVRSRCQRIQFHPLSADAVEHLLVDRHGIDAATARALAAAADGSPGRALALRRSLAGESWERLRQALATLGHARYVQLALMVQELTNPEADLGVKLEALLREYRDDAVRAVGAAHLAAPSQLATAPVSATLRRADAVHEARRTLRRTNPNRQLLLEALLLRLART